MASCTGVEDERKLGGMHNVAVASGIGGRVLAERLAWFHVCFPVDRGLHIFSCGEHGEVLCLIVVSQRDMIVVSCQHCHEGGIVIGVRMCSGNIAIGYQHVAFAIECAHNGAS